MRLQYSQGLLVSDLLCPVPHSLYLQSRGGVMSISVRKFKMSSSAGMAGDPGEDWSLSLAEVREKVSYFKPDL